MYVYGKDISAGPPRLRGGVDFLKRVRGLDRGSGTADCDGPTNRPSGNRSFIESRETRADAVDDRSRRARSETHAIETLLSRAHRRAFPGINPYPGIGLRLKSINSMAFATKRRRRDGRPTADVFAMRGGASGQMSVGHRVAPRARRLLWAILSLLLHSLPTVVLADSKNLLVPGSIIALHSTEHNRFVRMNGNGKMDSTDQHSWKFLPSGWTWERFRVVDVGNGDIALHCAAHNRFMRMNEKEYIMDRSKVKDWDKFPSGWKRERFRVVDAGNGEIALHCAYFNRFVWLN